MVQGLERSFSSVVAGGFELRQVGAEPIPQLGQSHPVQGLASACAAGQCCSSVVDGGAVAGDHPHDCVVGLCQAVEGQRNSCVALR